jgi:multidrug efflux system outer membrane protein
MRTARKVVSIVVGAGLLSGCAIGPDYTRPEVASPETFRGQAVAEAASFADARWWEVFEDPVLRDLIERALRQNYDVAIAAARVQEARANLGVARSEVFPSLDYAGSAGRARLPLNGLNLPSGEDHRTDDFFIGYMTLSWELDIWGRVRRSNEAARATLLATEDGRRAVWITLVSDVAQAYFEVLALDVVLQIARNSVQAYQGTYEIFLDRFTLGVASKLETSRALGALGNAQATVPQIQSRIVARENQLSILLGTAPGAIVRGRPMYEQPVVPVVPVGLPSALLERRPDLRQAEQELVAANARIGVAKADYFPRLSLTSLFGRASDELSSLTGGSATIWAVGGMITGPIFNVGRTTGQYRAAIARWEQTRLQYEKAVITALREVSDALTALEKLSEAETGQILAVEALEEAVEHATNRYRQGLAGYYEVLEAQQQLYPAQAQLAEIRRNRLLAYVQLYRALGGGWQLNDGAESGQGAAAATSPGPEPRTR